MKHVETCAICGHTDYAPDELDFRRLIVNFRDKNLPSAFIKYINVNGETQWVCHKCANLLAVSYHLSSIEVPAVESLTTLEGLTRDEDRE